MPAEIASDGEGLTFRPWTVSLRIVSQNSLPPISEILATEVRAALGDHLVGLYAYGSVVSGGFVPDVSDVDFVAVTVPDASALNLADLEQMHRDLVRRQPAWNDRIEVVYIGQSTLRSCRDAGILAAISPGEPLHLRDDAHHWLQNWYLVRETGMILYGPDPGSVIPPISRAEFLAAVARYADEVRQRDLRSMTPSDRAYSVLTMCRAWQTLATGTPCSKQEAASWARQRLPEWAWLVDAALTCRLSRGSIGFDDERIFIAAETFAQRIAAEIAQAAPDSS